MKRSILTWVGIVDSDVIGSDIIFGTKHGVPEMKSTFLYARHRVVMLAVMSRERERKK